MEMSYFLSVEMVENKSTRLVLLRPGYILEDVHKLRFYITFTKDYLNDM